MVCNKCKFAFDRDHNMIRYRLATFLKFLGHSTNQYGIHSPFIYQFLIKCLYKPLSKTQLNALKVNRKHVLNNTEVIEINDFGKGSQQFTTSQRHVNEMARKAGMSLHKAKLMNKIVGYFQTKAILELGTSVGLGSIAMATNHENITIDTIEACTNTCSTAKSHFNYLKLEHINVINSSFEQFFDQNLNPKPYDLIYLDGHHDKTATLQYFDNLEPYIHKDTIMIVDDIYWSKDMQQAWQELQKNQKVKVSIDLYFWGILFFKSGLSKQDFKIRCFI